jgi:hypothetical protein
MNLSDTITNPRTGRVSTTKAATALAYILGSFWFCYHNYVSGFNPELWFIYFGVVAGHQSISKGISMYFQRGREASASDSP